MRGKCLIAGMIAVLAPWASAMAQTDGCEAAPPGQPGIPLQLDLGSLPGAANRKVTGSALVMVPAAPPSACLDQQPHLPRDVLHGDPGNALNGEGPPDLMRGPGPARVEYGPAGPQRPVR